VQKNNNEALDTLEEIIAWITDSEKTDGAVAIQNSITDINKKLLD
jgi:hypothetical protein